MSRLSELPGEGLADGATEAPGDSYHLDAKRSDAFER
jgi:hypothetical protein